MAIKNYFIEDHWKIGYIDKPITDIISDKKFFEQIKWIRAREGEFLADPFWCGNSNSNSIYCESFDYRSQVGSIVQIDGILNGNQTFKTILNDGSHFSFPSVFEHENEILMLPENSASSKLKFYSINENHKLKLAFDIAAVDPILLFDSGTYYLFCSILDGSQNNKLELFYTDNLGAAWQKHPCSPIHHLKNGSRMAGNIIREGEKLIRPGQLNSNNYGGGIALFHILEISKKKYREELIKVILPPSEFDGIHTINKFGSGTILDLKNEKFHLLKPWWRLRHKFFGKKSSL